MFLFDFSWEETVEMMEHTGVLCCMFLFLISLFKEDREVNEDETERTVDEGAKRFDSP